VAQVERHPLLLQHRLDQLLVLRRAVEAGERPQPRARRDLRHRSDPLDLDLLVHVVEQVARHDELVPPLPPVERRVVRVELLHLLAPARSHGRVAVAPVGREREASAVFSRVSVDATPASTASSSPGTNSISETSASASSSHSTSNSCRRGIQPWYLLSS